MQTTFIGSLKAMQALLQGQTNPSGNAAESGFAALLEALQLQLGASAAASGGAAAEASPDAAVSDTELNDSLGWLQTWLASVTTEATGPNVDRTLDQQGDGTAGDEGEAAKAASGSPKAVAEQAAPAVPAATVQPAPVASGTGTTEPPAGEADAGERAGVRTGGATAPVATNGIASSAGAVSSTAPGQAVAAKSNVAVETAAADVGAKTAVSSTPPVEAVVDDGVGAPVATPLEDTQPETGNGPRLAESQAAASKPATVRGADGGVTASKSTPVPDAPVPDVAEAPTLPKATKQHYETQTKHKDVSNETPPATAKAASHGPADAARAASTAVPSQSEPPPATVAVKAAATEAAVQAEPAESADHRLSRTIEEGSVEGDNAAAVKAAVDSATDGDEAATGKPGNATANRAAQWASDLRAAFLRRSVDPEETRETQHRREAPVKVEATEAAHAKVAGEADAEPESVEPALEPKQPADGARSPEPARWALGESESDPVALSDTRPPAADALHADAVDDVAATTAKSASAPAANRSEVVPSIKVVDSSGPVDLGQYVVRQVRVSEGNGSQTWTVRLVPESLGSLKVEVTTVDNQVSVRLVSPTNSVRETLEGHLHRLHEALAREGMEVTRVVVASQSSGGSQFTPSDAGAHGGRAHHQPAPGNASGQASNTNNNDGGSWSSQDQSSRGRQQPRRNPSGLDLFA